MICSKCHQEIADNSTFCPICGYNLAEPAPDTQAQPAPVKDDSGIPDWMLLILGLLWPVAGLIIWAVYHKSNPAKGKIALRGAVISLLVSAALSLMFFVLWFIYMIIIVFFGVFGAI